MKLSVYILIYGIGVTPDSKIKIEVNISFDEEYGTNSGAYLWKLNCLIYN